jgi:hypothetical protein
MLIIGSNKFRAIKVPFRGFRGENTFPEWTLIKLEIYET